MTVADRSRTAVKKGGGVGAFDDGGDLGPKTFILRGKTAFFVRFPDDCGAAVKRGGAFGGGGDFKAETSILRSKTATVQIIPDLPSKKGGEGPLMAAVIIRKSAHCEKQTGQVCDIS